MRRSRSTDNAKSFRLPLSASLLDSTSRSLSVVDLRWLWLWMGHKTVPCFSGMYATPRKLACCCASAEMAKAAAGRVARELPPPPPPPPPLLLLLRTVL